MRPPDLAKKGNELSIQSYLIQSIQMLPDLGVVDAQELVCRSSHVDEVRLTLRTFAVKKLVDRLVLRRLL